MHHRPRFTNAGGRSRQRRSIGGVIVTMALLATLLTGVFASATPTPAAADPDGPGHGCPDCIGGPGGQGNNGSNVDNDDVRKAGIVMNTPSCIAAICGPATYLGFLWGGPVLGLPVLAVCSSGCAFAEGMNAFRESRFEITVDPKSDRTWANQRATINRRLARMDITQKDANFLTRHFQAVGRKIEKMVPGNCFNEQGRMVCESWVEPLRIGKALSTFTVSPNVGDSGSGTTNPAKPANGTEFTCTNGRVYQSGGTAYRQKGNGGAVKCPGVQLPLHVYCNNTVVGVIQPSQPDGTGSC